jgi:hypothetical protein
MRTNLEKVYLKVTDGHGPVDVGCKIQDGVLIDVLTSNDISIWDRLSLQNRASLARHAARIINKPVTVHVQ